MRHMETHLGVKHTCDVCGKEYSKQYTLKQHMLTHGDEADQPFHCEWCGQAFVRKDKYVAHMKTHPEKIDVMEGGDKESVTDVL